MLVAAHFGLLVTFDLARWPALTYALLATAFAAWVWAVRSWEKNATPMLIIAVATLLRLFLLPLPPTLSDDTLRYVWDGRVVRAGFNPYQWAPEAEELAELRDPMWERMPHKEVPTVYPPLALTVFSLGSLLPFPLVSVKILITLAEILGCYLLLRLAAVRGLPAGRVAWYAWCPLASMEVAGMGHIDGIVVAAQAGAVLWLASGPSKLVHAGVAGAAGVLAKLVPLVVLPTWARQSGRPWFFLTVTGLVLVVAFLPVAISVGGVPPGLVRYGVSWEFNGPLYEPLWRLIDRAEITDEVKGTLDKLGDATVGDFSLGRERLYPLYHYVYPQFMAKLILLAVFGVLYLLVWRDPRLIEGTGRVMSAVVLVTATFYPWYLLWVLPWAALARHRAWLVLAATIQLAYLPGLTGVDLFPWIFLVIWLPFFLLLARERWSID